MTTERLYYDNPKQYAANATLLRIGEPEEVKYRVDGKVLKGECPYLILDKTIFHPQGGGQPADIGTIAGLNIVMALDTNADEGNIRGEIKHYLLPNADLSTLKEESEVEMQINADYRNSCSRSHTAGHLISALLDHGGMFAKHQPTTFRGHHFPAEENVQTRFAGDAVEDKNAFKAAANEQLKQAISAGLPIFSSRNPDGVRLIGIGDHPNMPCGGTHVENLSELDPEKTEITKFKKEKGELPTLKMSYRC